MLSMSICILFIFLFVEPSQSTILDDQTIVSHPQERDSCNKVLCASIVSYCLIQEKCNCDPAKNCSCCAECAVCLGDYYRHCCDCVGMRSGSNYTAALPATTSTVGILDNPEPELFNSLTSQPMPALRCSILRFPVIEELAAHHRRRPHHHKQHSAVEDSERSRGVLGNAERPSNTYWSDVQVVLRNTYDVNIRDSRTVCTAAYFDDCMSLNECMFSCERMGSSTYRWFHNGCCECAGPTCLNYGNMYPKCTECLQ